MPVGSVTACPTTLGHSPSPPQWVRAGPGVFSGPPAFGTLEMAVALEPSASAAFEMENKAAAGAERGPTASAGKSHPQRNKKHRPRRGVSAAASCPSPQTPRHGRGGEAEDALAL